MAPGDHFFNVFLDAFEDGLHPSIGEVLHPSPETAVQGFFFRVHAEADPLYPAGDQDMSTGSFHDRTIEGLIPLRNRI